MKSLTRGLYVALATSILGNLGCSAAAPEETVSELQQGLDIASWNDLVLMGSSGSYTLTQDIDAAGKTWTPKAFSGTFDGGNHVIKNLTINGGSFFSVLSNATIRRLKFTDLTITGGNTEGIGGLATRTENTTIERCAVHVNMSVSASTAGGLVGQMNGGSIYRSYAKGQILGNMFYAGGLVGSAHRSTITESYAQVTVAPSTPSAYPVVAGGLVGYAYGPVIYDAYAVGGVTGRGGVGGIVGNMNCADDAGFVLFKTIYRGDVIDRDWESRGGWSGALGTVKTQCASRVAQNFYDRSLDGSTNRAAHSSIRGYTTDELRTPTTVTGGVFCEPDVVPGRCGDLTWSSPPWTAGSSSQHHVLMNMPGPNPQPR